MLKADLHIHTNYSKDCATSPEQVIARCLKIGINCIAITDHQTIDGAIKTQQIAPFPVIVGGEFMTTSGEIMGLFLSEPVPHMLPLEEAVAIIKAQGGLVCIPHPFDRLRPSALKEEMIEKILPQVDMIEVFNSRNILQCDLERARLLAQSNGLVASAGSDAHLCREIGRAYIEMREFQGKDDFLKALAQGRIIGHRSNPLVHMASVWAKLRKGS